MSLEKSLRSQALKNCAQLKEFIESGLDHDSWQEAQMALHTLKGDLAYARERRSLLLLDELRGECESILSGNSPKKALGMIDQLSSMLVFAQVENAEDWIERMQTSLRFAIGTIAGELGKKIELVVNANIPEPSLESQLYLHTLLTPLISNSCVHGIGAKGVVCVSFHFNGDDLEVIISESGELPDGRSKSDYLFSGQGLGLRLVAELAGAKRGKMSILRDPRFHITIKIPRAELAL